MGEKCPQCGAEWRDGATCEDHFYQMIAWEFTNEGGSGVVHHLTVLCYFLQHPAGYSVEGLQNNILLLRDFMNGMTPAQIRRDRRDQVDSGKRTWKIKGDDVEYEPPVIWTLTVRDAISGGLQGYCERVHAWAKSVYESLQAAGYYTAT